MNMPSTCCARPNTTMPRRPSAPSWSERPQDYLAGNAQYWMGETYYVRGRYQDAAVTFAEGYQKYPTNSKAPDNLLKLGMSLGQLGKKADACVAFAQGFEQEIPHRAGQRHDAPQRKEAPLRLPLIPPRLLHSGGAPRDRSGPQNSPG